MKSLRKLITQKSQLGKQNQKIAEPKESEEIFRVIATKMSEGVTIADLNGKYTYVNPAFCKMSGYSNEELLNMTVFNMKADENSPNTTFNETQTKGYSRGEYIELRKKDGSVYYTLITGQKIKLNNNDYTIGVINDISELKQREDELNDTISTKNKFFSIISHDLRGSVGGALQLISVLKDNFKNYSEERCIQIINACYESTEKSYNLLVDLLTWANNQNGTIKFNSELFDTFTFVKSNIDVVKQLAEQKEIIIENGVTESIDIFADKESSNIVLRNLLFNAIKFTPRQGSVTVLCKEIRKNKKPFVEISVIDTGIGISEKTVAKLFKAEESSSTYGTENETGTGLGLLLCKEFVTKNGGEIWVESETGNGTTFYFTLPLLE